MLWFRMLPRSRPALKWMQALRGSPGSSCAGLERLPSATWSVMGEGWHRRHSRRMVSSPKSSNRLGNGGSAIPITETDHWWVPLPQDGFRFHSCGWSHLGLPTRLGKRAVLSYVPAAGWSLLMSSGWPICFTLEVQPPFFIGWFPNHHYFSRGLSSSKRNHHF